MEWISKCQAFKGQGRASQHPAEEMEKVWTGPECVRDLRKHLSLTFIFCSGQTTHFNFYSEVVLVAVRRISRDGKKFQGFIYKINLCAVWCSKVLKEIPVGDLKPDETVKATQEAQLLSQLHYPAILRFYTSFLERDTFCIITEFCEVTWLFFLWVWTELWGDQW